MKIFIAILTAFILCSASVSAQQTRVSGYVFGDYFYKIDGDSSGSGTQYSNYNKDVQAFDLRRLYVIFDHDISNDFTAKVVLEGNSGTTLGNGKYTVAIKNFSLTWNNLIPNDGKLKIGLISPHTWKEEEKIWNYRSIEKTVGDARKFGSSSDFGISAEGNFDKKNKYGYFAMIGNGNSNKPEFNKQKKFYGRLTARPVKELTVSVYGDYEDAGTDVNTTTLNGVLGYNSPRFNIGTSVYRVIEKNTTLTDVKPFGFSAFAWAPISMNKKLNINAFARIDLYNPDTENTTSGFKQTFITAGLDFMPLPNVHIMPNIWINSYSDKSSSNVDRPSDVVGRVTFYYKYK